MCEAFPLPSSVFNHFQDVHVPCFHEKVQILHDNIVCVTMWDTFFETSLVFPYEYFSPLKALFLSESLVAIGGLWATRMSWEEKSPRDGLLALQGDYLMDVMDSAFSIHNLYGILSGKVQIHNECGVKVLTVVGFASTPLNCQRWSEPGCYQGATRDYQGASSCLFELSCPSLVSSSQWTWESESLNHSFMKMLYLLKRYNIS